MNMYGFTKVNKLVKEKAYLYFKNDDFIEGDMYSSCYSGRAWRELDARRTEAMMSRVSPKPPKLKKEEVEPKGTNTKNKN